MAYRHANVLEGDGMSAEDRFNRLIEMVKTMRQLQEEYSRNKNQDTLFKAKAAEAAVDKTVAEHNSDQLELFG